MNELNDRIQKEKKHYKNLRKKIQIIGSILIALGTGFGLVLYQGNGLAPIAGTLVAALYIGMGIAILSRYININHEEEKSISDIKMDDKIDKILSRLEDKCN